MNIKMMIYHSLITVFLTLSTVIALIYVALTYFDSGENILFWMILGVIITFALPTIVAVKVVRWFYLNGNNHKKIRKGARRA